MGDRSITLAAVGDISLGDHPLCAGFGTHSRFKARSPEFAFERVKPLLQGSDILFGNLECTLSEFGRRPGDYHSIQMRGHESYLNGLTATGFDVLNVANNHSLQHGHRPFLETVGLLRDNGIAVCGVGATDYRHAVAEVVKAHDLGVAFLGYSLRPRQYFTEAPLYAEGQRDSILADVRAARARDVVVVSLHWGDEFIEQPSPEDVALAHDIMDAGADLIIGHHPHVLRGVERYGRGYIVYSLGNFVCDMLWDERMRESAVLRCRLSRDGASDLTLTPVRIGDDYRPAPLDNARAVAIKHRIDKLSEAIGTPAAFSESLAEYQAAALDALRWERRKAHRYFLRNAYQFPVGILIQQLTTFARNRLAERRLVNAD
jgi:poly-gamma-glutamate capsule biosynthesis protein CapA/YwtB (metallophosphatase superfamily)